MTRQGSAPDASNVSDVPNAIYYHLSDITPLILAFSSANLGISSITLMLCIFLSIKRKRLLRMTMFRAITILQLDGVLKTIMELYAVKNNPKKEASCRWVTFSSLVFAISPLYISVFCILYIQITLIHHVPITKKLPKRLLVLGCCLFSLVPPSFVLYISPRQAGLESFCDYAGLPNRRLTVFKWLVGFVWIVIAGVIGIVSMSVLLVNIKRESRKIAKEMPKSYQKPSSNLIVRKLKLNNSNALVLRALVSTIWFPVIPIISLWFAAAYSIVKYKLQRSDNTLNVVDIVLQSLEVPFMALTFYTHPPVIRAFQQYKTELKAKKSGFSHEFTEVRSRQFEDRFSKSTVTRPSTIAQAFDPSLSQFHGESSSV